MRWLVVAGLLGACMAPFGAEAAVPQVVVGFRGRPPPALRKALDQAVRDAGRKPLEGRALAGRGGRGALRALAACKDDRCLRRMARRLRAEVWVAAVDRSSGAPVLRMEGALRARPLPDVDLPVPSDEELAAVAYGAFYRALGGRGQGRLSLTSVPVGAQVVAGGSPLGPTPLSDAPLAAGAIRLELRAPGYVPWGRQVQVRPGAALTLDVALQADAGGIPLTGLTEAATEIPLTALAPEAEGAPAPAAEEVPDEEEALAETFAPEAVARAAAGRPAALSVEPAPTRARGTTWIALGGGAAAVAAGSVLGLTAGDRAALARAPTTPQVQVPGLNRDAGSAAMAANVLFGVGAAALSLGSWMLVQDLTGP